MGTFSINKKLAAGVLAAAMALSSLAAPASYCTGAVTACASSFGSENTDDFSKTQVTVKDAYSAVATSIRINWEKVDGASGYRVYRYDAAAKGYIKVKTLYGEDTNTYKATGLTAGTKYTYKVKAFKKTADKTIWGIASKAKYVCTAPSGISKVTGISINNNRVTLKWEKVKCTGYLIYRYDPYNDSWVRIKTLVGQSLSSCVINMDSYPYTGLLGYRFKVKAYTKDAAGGMKYTTSSGSDTVYDINAITDYMQEEIEALDTVKGAPKTNYILYNVQGTTTTKTSCTISQADKEAIERFAAKHFKSSWTPAQKAAYTLNWINKNVTYASGSLYSTIWDKGYAVAIFDMKLGQCLQYNGALVEMCNYLGFDASLVQGYRGTSTSNKWQHFWGEITINKKPCVLEAGNYGESGNWMFLAVPYKYAPKYIKNNKVMN
ncbi:MAG: transglutaminase domain-containing protein [Oscillospiraceae bacterium]